MNYSTFVFSQNNSMTHQFNQPNTHVNKHGKYILRISGGRSGLVEATTKMNIHQFRIYLVALTLIKSQDKDFQEVFIRIIDLIELSGVNMTGKYYTLIREAARNLTSVNIEIHERNDDDSINTVVIPLVENSREFVNENKQNLVGLTFHASMSPHMHNLKGNYLTMDIRTVIGMKSVYSMKLYMVLKHYINLKSRKQKFDIERLKQTLGIKDEYSSYGSFKQRVLTKCQAEINEYTDLLIADIVEEKKGKRVIEVSFLIRQKEYPKKVKATPPVKPTVSLDKQNGISQTPDNQDVRKITDIDLNVENDLNYYLNIASDFDITEQTINSWNANFSSADIEYGIKYTLDKLKKGDTIDNIAGYMNKMVRETDFRENNLRIQDENEAEKREQERLKKENKEKVERKKEREENINSLRRNYYAETVSLSSHLIERDEELQKALMSHIVVFSEHTGTMKVLIVAGIKEHTDLVVLTNLLNNHRCKHSNEILEYLKANYQHQFLGIYRTYNDKIVELGEKLDF